jgi:hypothetical protein
MFTDDYTHWTALHLLCSKDETFGAYKNFAAWAFTQYSTVIQRLCLDHRGEFTSNTFTNYLDSQGTKRQLTMHDTPQHNGVAESLNRQILEHTHMMLHHSGLPKNLWGEATCHVVWLKNHTSMCVIGNSTPHKQLISSKPILSGIPEWGQPVWVHNHTGTKLKARASEGHWVGYDADSTHAHCIYWPEQRRITMERNIKFKPYTITIQIPRLALIIPPSLAQIPLPPSLPASSPPPTLLAPPTSPLAPQSPPLPLTPLLSAAPQEPEPKEDAEQQEIEQQITMYSMPTAASKSAMIHPTDYLFLCFCDSDCAYYTYLTHFHSDSSPFTNFDCD